MTPKKYLYGRYATKTDIGKVRMNNEDRVTALTNSRGNILLVVCDGMGGQNKGDLASSLAINTITTSFKSRKGFLNRYFAKLWVGQVIREANKSIYEQSQSNKSYHGMGTTITLLLIIKDTAILGHVGDSRCYFLRNRREFTQMSEDQTYVGYLLRTGQINQEEALTHPKRHVLMNALGVYPSASVDVKSFPYMGETVLLCSDGLYNNVPVNDIASVLKGEDTVEQKVDELIAIGNKNGGSDNIAVVIWEAQE
jgi:protein phosphatase